MHRISKIAIIAGTVMMGATFSAFAEGGGCTVDCDPPDEKVKGNNGWGNGDQPAPGNSKENNNAENNNRPTVHPIHGDPDQD